jgi:hypothetical protein
MYSVMSIILAFKYIIITFAFIPLFCFIVIRMKQTFPPEGFNRIKCKTITLFSVYGFLLILRLTIYLDLRLFDKVLT